MEAIKLNNNVEVVDGDIAVILRALEDRIALPLGQLQDLCHLKLNSDEMFGPVYAHVETAGFVLSGPRGIELTDSGRVWLADRRVELSVEDESSVPEDVPKQPYDVAKLNVETRNVSVFQALRKIESDQINISPDFQRAFVWDEVRQSRLIESILIRIPLPAFYLDATDQINWNVVDGLQRLTTLYNYCRKESFALRGLQFLSELEGCRFSDLPAKFRVLIEDDTQLLFYNLMPGTPIQAKFTIFSRVNTGGMQLTPQEIRHALNQGRVTKLLAELANHHNFRRATKGVVESLRMGDRELVVRVLAFMHLGVDEYKKFNELDGFLVHAMATLNKVSDDALHTLSKNFLQNLEKVDAVFGRHAYRKMYSIGGRRSPFNKALFEVWTTTVGPYSLSALEMRRDDILEDFVHLTNSSDPFARSISSSTSSFNAVSTRFRLIEDLLKQVLND